MRLCIAARRDTQRARKSSHLRAASSSMHQACTHDLKVAAPSVLMGAHACANVQACVRPSLTSTIMLCAKGESTHRLLTACIFTHLSGDVKVMLRFDTPAELCRPNGRCERRLILCQCRRYEPPSGAPQAQRALVRDAALRGAAAAGRGALSICFLNLSLEHVARLGNLFCISE